MNRVVLAVAAPLLLIGAAYPEGDKPEIIPDEPLPAMTEGPTTYRPCRPGPGDDRCIQLYERGVRAADARWLRARGDEPRTEVAMGGPDEPVARRHRAHHRQRCLDEGDEARGM
jgi:hypothetical protein